MTSFATTSSGTRIAYFESGRPWRPALILTHSLGSDHRMWAPQIEALKSDYSIIAIDNSATVKARCHPATTRSTISQRQ